MKMDPSLRFYFAHKTQIDEWVALQRLIPEEAIKFMGELASSLQREAESLSGRPEVALRLDCDWPIIALFRRSLVHIEPDKPHVSICIAANSAKAQFHTLISGVVADFDGPAYAKVYPRMKEELARNAGEDGGLVSKYWPRYWQEPVLSEFWDHLDDFRDVLVKRMAAHWMRFAPVVDEVLAGI